MHPAPDRSSPLSQSLDIKRDVPGGNSIGPFQLGLAQSTLRKGEKVQKWSELDTKGKVLRTTARTSNLTVILFGAGLSALLVYSLTSELFSKNSPTVLYGDACERIKTSPKVSKYLHSPLTFHNNPPSTLRPRHRNRHVMSQIMVDAHGQEHMIMTFYVQGRPPGSDIPTLDSSYFVKGAQWLQDCVSSLSELTWDESMTWTQEHADDLWDRSKSLFKYLSGSPTLVPALPPFPSASAESQKSEGTRTWSFAGMFSSLKSPKGSQAESKQGLDGRVFTDGQVHAHFVRNREGYFIFRYLLIDLPSSRHANSVRVFVERAPGVRDNEPVMRWKSEF